MKKINVAIVNISILTLIAFIIFIYSIGKGETWRIIFASVGLAGFALMLLMLIIRKNKLRKEILK